MEDHICTVPECEGEAIRRGWCGKHYARWRKHGDPEKTLRVKRTCVIEGCDRYRQGRGLCGLHYQRWYTYGDPLATKLIAAPARFWSKVDKRGGPNECWSWKAKKDREGYAVFWVDGSSIRAARYAYMLLVGTIPDGYSIDHVWARGCTRRDCTNPAHLEAVPPGVNTLRGNTYSGVNARKTHCDHGHALTPENIYVPPKRPGTRQCRKCRAERCRKYQASKRA